MTKDLSINILMDFYGQLLSERQYEMMDMYYNQDLSLGEIAAETSISRQGVRDLVKRGERQLAEFEEKLGLAERFAGITADIEEMNEIINTLPDTAQIKRLKELSVLLKEKI